MEAVSIQQQQQLFETRYDCVCGWENLTGEPKVAWYKLWKIAGRRPGTITVHVAVVGEHQNATDPSRTGKRLVSTLANHGLVQILDRSGPQWTIHLFDPLVVQKNRLVVPPAEFQQELFHHQAPPDFSKEPEATIPFSPPEPAAVAPQSVEPTLSLDVDKEARASTCNVEFNVGESISGATAAGSLKPPGLKTFGVRYTRREGEPEPLPDQAGYRTYAAAIDRLADQAAVSRDQREQDAARIAQEVFMRVRDPDPHGFFRSVCKKIGAAVANLQLPRYKLDRAFETLDQFHRDSPGSVRGKYFVGSIKASFDECRIEFTKKKPAAEAPQPPPGTSEGIEIE